MGPTKKVAGIALAVIAALMLIGQLVTPFILRSYVNGHGQELLGRQVYIDDVSVNLFTGAISLDSLIVFGQQPEEEPFVQLHQFRTNLAMLHLLAGVLDMEYFELNGLNLNIEQRDTVFNFSDILMHFSAEETSDKGTDEGMPIVLRNIAISNSYLHYRDLLVHSDFRINNISLRIPGIDLRELNTSVGMDLTFVDGGNLTTQFTYDEKRFTYSVDMQVSDFNMQGLLPYIQQFIMAEEFDGTLNANLQLRGNIKHILDFRLTGMANARELSLHDDDDVEILRCDSMSIGVNEVSLLKNRIGLSHVIMYNPMIELTYGRDSIDNFTRLMERSAAQREQELKETDWTQPEDLAPDNQPDFQLRITQFQLHGGNLFYHDLANRAKPFHYQIADLNVNAPLFSLNGYNNIKGKALLGEKGVLTLEYHGRLDDPRNLRFNLKAQGIELNDFTPYTLQMFGNEVLNGVMSGEILANVHNGNLQGNIHLNVRDPQVSKRKKGIDAEMHVPFRAGVYALTDRNGVCDIELPMSGDIDEPRFSYKRVIFRTLGKLFVKVCTSPFKQRSATTSAQDYSGHYDAFDIESVDIDSFGNDSIGEVLMKEEYK